MQDRNSSNSNDPRPPEVDHNSPLELSIRSTRLMGILSVIIGLTLMIFWGLLNASERFGAIFFAMGFVVWFVPGVLFLVCEIFLERRRRSAVVWAIFTATIQAIFAVGCLIASLVLPPVSLIPIVLSALWLAAMIQMIHHLRRSLSAVNLDTEHRPAFEIISFPPAATAITVADDDAREIPPSP